ncbi:hypothetical protein CDD81_282 [Ophiocordyceps australis]|uniref:Vacuolar membrane protein n=1 Tax=Ophiocordyceps australis TaxID=1399860 RepID=A0A2C5XWA2_9HYPO|nr:hypothetical protein CDD81_282 [Ophiocordyceps australis]
MLQPAVALGAVHHAARTLTATMEASTTALQPSSALAMATTTGTASPASPHDQDSQQGECRLLGPFALLVQLALGGLALLSLVYKRWRERPQRPVKIWFFDVSKQVFGSVLVHIANVFMSMLTSGRFSVSLDSAVPVVAARSDDSYQPNPCSFYLLNLAIDTTLGIPILIVLLRVMTALVALTPLGKPTESIQSGNYGSPPNVWWWLKQSVIYFCGLFGMKICVLIIFLVMPWISMVGDWALGWTEGNERLQIAFVMMIFPLVMNALQYYIIDSFIKMKEPEHQRLPSQDPDQDHVGHRESSRLRSRIRADRGSEHGGADEHGDQLSKLHHRSLSSGDDEYDPDVDGDAPTVFGSSSSRRGVEQTKATTSHLFPKE